MKLFTFYLCLLLLWLPLTARPAEPVSLEAFQRLSSAQRQAVIDQAAPEQIEALIKLDIHLTKLERLGGEAGLKRAKENEVIIARGLWELEDIFATQRQLWQGYVGQRITDDEKKGMPHAQLVEEQRKLDGIQDAKMKSIRKRQKEVHAIAFHLAATPQALALNAKAKALDAVMESRVFPDNDAPFKPVTDAEQAQYDKQVDAIYEAVQKLPRLPAGQAEKEYDEFPDQRVFDGGAGG